MFNSRVQLVESRIDVENNLLMLPRVHILVLLWTLAPNIIQE